MPLSLAVCSLYLEDKVEDVGGELLGYGQDTRMRRYMNWKKDDPSLMFTEGVGLRAINMLYLFRSQSYLENRARYGWECRDGLGVPRCARCAGCTRVYLGVPGCTWVYPGILGLPGYGWVDLGLRSSG